MVNGRINDGERKKDIQKLVLGMMSLKFLRGSRTLEMNTEVKAMGEVRVQRLRL